MAAKLISINRATVLTLWAAVVAERLGFDEDEALTPGKAGLNAQAKGRRLGIFRPQEEGDAPGPAGLALGAMAIAPANPKRITIIPDIHGKITCRTARPAGQSFRQGGAGPRRETARPQQARGR